MESVAQTTITTQLAIPASEDPSEQVAASTEMARPTRNNGPPTYFCLHCGRTVHADVDTGQFSSFKTSDLPFYDWIREKIEPLHFYICLECPANAVHHGPEVPYEATDPARYTTLLFVLATALEVMYDSCAVATLFSDIVLMLKEIPRAEVLIYYKAVAACDPSMINPEELALFQQRAAAWNKPLPCLEALPVKDPSGIESIHTSRRPFPGLDPKILFSLPQFKAIMAQRSHDELMAYWDMASATNSIELLLQYQKDNQTPCKNYIGCH